MITTDAMAIVYGLSSALTWGAGDFSGGYASRKTKVLAVILYSQIIGVLALMGLQLFITEAPPAPSSLGWGGLAGFFGAIGLVALYKGFAVGRMGVVAPVSAVATVALPIIVALFTEGPPTRIQAMGFAGALIAVWLFSSGQGRIRLFKAELGLSLLAGMGFSLFFVCIDRVSATAVLWPLVAARAASIAFIASILVLRRQLCLPSPGHLPFIAMAGIFDTAGNAFFALASQLGRLDVSAILASMYPAATVLLARCFLKEPLGPKQNLGLLAACAALALFAV